MHNPEIAILLMAIFFIIPTLLVTAASNSISTHPACIFHLWIIFFKVLF